MSDRYIFVVIILLFPLLASMGRRMTSHGYLSRSFLFPQFAPLFSMLLLLFIAAPVMGATAEDRKQAPLVSAIIAKDGSKTAALLESGEYIEQKNISGITPLMAAVTIGDEKLVRLLLDRGASAYARSSSGQTPLSFAAANGNIAIVRILLESGSSVDRRDNDSKTPLMYAAENGNYESVLLLLDYGADPKKKNDQNQNLLMLAATGGNLEIVALFLDMRLSPDEQDSEGFTALVHSLHHPGISRLLVSRGADLDAMVSIKRGEFVLNLPILAMAAFTENDLSVRTLLELGADVNEKGGYGFTPLLAACLMGNWDAAQLMLQTGASADPVLLSIPEEPEMGGTTPLILASAAGQVEIVRLLLQKGVDINRRSDAKTTALMVAERGGHTEVAELLRQQGATISETERQEAEAAGKGGNDSQAQPESTDATT